MQNRKTAALLAGNAGISRRRFLQGVAAGGALVGLGGFERPVWALAAESPRQELRGTEFELSVGEIPVNFTGKMGVATAVNGQVPAPLLRWREGDTVTLKVTNRLQVPTSIHWHGIVLPNAMDGVPGMTFDGIAPGESFTYQFPVRQSGTYWYHSHSGFQEQTGLYGPLIIEPREPAPYHFDREYVVMLSDWSDASPEHIYNRLKKMGDYYNYAQPTLLDFIHQARQEGWSKAFDERMAWDRMRMSPRDLADVSGATYTYLMNGTAPAGNWTGLFKRGEKVLLRFINGSAMSYFDVRIPGLKMTVVAADGQYVHPVSVDEFRMAVAETYDVIVEPDEARAYTLFAQSMDRSGFARGTLAPQPGMSAPVPPLDPIPSLTMADMGMTMDEMPGMDDHGEMPGMATDNHRQAKNTASTSEMPGMAMDDHDGMASMAPDKHRQTRNTSSTSEMPGMVMDDHDGMAGMATDNHHQAMNTASTSGMPGVVMDDQGEMAGMATDNHRQAMNTTSTSEMPGMAMHGGAMQTALGAQGEHSHAAMSGTGHDSAMAMPAKANSGMMQVKHHPATESGPGSSMQASVVSTRLDDPGIGLRNNGRRVLTYADLRSMGGWLDGREPSRTLELHLTGNMERYMWSFDGVSYSDAAPIQLRLGEVVRVVLINDTMMDHPIHLHGMWSELENGEGGFQVRKHTVSVKPGHAVTYRVLADASGRWAYHCHLLYHMNGMFREVIVS